MSDKPKEFTLEEAHEALRKLDALIEQICPDEHITIDAIGGYAIMEHGILDTRRTIDIDTMTTNYSRSVQMLIEEVGTACGFEPNWINNENIYFDGIEPTDEDIDAARSIINAHFEPINDLQLSHIRLAIADIPTLVHSKAYALCDSAMNAALGRTRDKDASDFKALVESQNCHSLRDVEEQFPFIKDPVFDKSRTQIASVFTGNYGPTVDAINEAREELLSFDDFNSIDASIDDYDYYSDF